MTTPTPHTTDLEEVRDEVIQILNKARCFPQGRVVGNYELCGLILDHLAQRGMIGQGWQDIATAPRDGTEILVIWRGKVRMAKYNNKPRRDAHSNWFIYHSSYYQSHVVGGPEVWQPLPAPTAAVRNAMEEG